ncbi:MAG TPA: LysR substrate-binding domain-containing protein [Magnetospirillaceae bacterium]|jgi:DNA-binding transcriptional LysR family regulator
MTLEQIRIFLEVAERLHFTRAAEALHLTQSAVSAAIAALETRHDVRLFDRVGRHVELTAEGAAFAEQAREVLLAAERATRALDDLSTMARGSLTLIGSQTVASYWLPPLLYRFRQRYPGIQTTLSVGNTEQVAEAVKRGAADLGVVEGNVDDPVLRVEPVAHDQLALVVGAAHRWAADRAIDADALRKLPWVLREPGSGTRAATEALLKSRGLSLSDVTIAFEAPTNEAVRSAVEAGAGASVLSTSVADSGFKAGTLQAAACALPGRHFSTVIHRQRRPSRAVRAFLDMIPGADLRRAG